MRGVSIGMLKLAVVSAVLGVVALSGAAHATSRIKDLANIEGVRQNQLIGYGLVVGLNGTGDTLNNIPFTKQSLQAMLERMGVNIRGATIRTGNVAAVMVTGNHFWFDGLVGATITLGPALVLARRSPVAAKARTPPRPTARTPSTRCQPSPSVFSP